MGKGDLFHHESGFISSLKTATIVAMIIAGFTWFIAIIGWMYGHPMDPNVLTFVTSFFGVAGGARMIQQTFQGKGFLAKVFARPQVREVSPEPEPEPELKEPSTANFSLHEFHCNDRTHVPEEHYGDLQRLMNDMEVIRAEAGNKPVHITSGYRTPEHNRISGGKKESQHLQSKASDFWIEGKSPTETFAIVDFLQKEGKITKGGAAMYNNGSVHHDIRGHIIRWQN